MRWLNRIIRKSVEWRVGAFLLFVIALILLRYVIIGMT